MVMQHIHHTEGDNYMIATITLRGNHLALAVRKERNTMERCIDAVDRPNTLPYVIHSLPFPESHQLLVSLSVYDKDTNELDIVTQEYFDIDDIKSIKKYSTSLVFMAKDDWLTGRSPETA